MSKTQNREMDDSLTYRDALEILQLIKSTEFCESLDLQFGDLKLSIRRGAAAAADAQPTTAIGTAPERAEAGAQPDAVTVRAPNLGIFHRQAAPGDVVEADDILAAIAVMKQRSPLPAGVAGRIVEILVEDGVLVEHGQPVAVIASR